MGAERRRDMKRYILASVFAAMLVPMWAFGQEGEQGKDVKHQIELREMELQLQGREAKMDFERKIQELELEKRKIELEHIRRPHKPGPHPLLLLCAVVHILVAVWVYQDIRQRNCGSGIWIVIALLTGLLGALVYAVVRIGDTKKTD